MSQAVGRTTLAFLRYSSKYYRRRIGINRVSAIESAIVYIVSPRVVIPVSLDQIAGSRAGCAANQCSFTVPCQSSNQSSARATYERAFQQAMMVIHVIVTSVDVVMAMVHIVVTMVDIVVAMI